MDASASGQGESIRQLEFEVEVDVDAEFDPDFDERADARSCHRQDLRKAEAAVRRAFLFSLLLHTVFVLFRTPDSAPEPRDEPRRTRNVGFTGPERLGALSIPSQRASEIDRSARRRSPGAVHLMRVTPVRAIAGPAERTVTPTPRALPIPVAPASRDQTRAVGTGPVDDIGPLLREPPRFIMRDDWSSAASSRPAAQTQGFRVVELVRPQYPERAIERDEEGLVRLEARVSPSGRVVGVDVMESSSSVALDASAIAAMERWTFAPYLEEGEPTGFTIVVPFRFRLVE